MSDTSSGGTTVLDNLPSIDSLLRDPRVKEVISLHGVEQITAIVRKQVNDLREEIFESGARPSAQGLYTEAVSQILKAATARTQRGIRRVINATGIVLHTNLGRAPLSGPARAALDNIGSGYCSVEYDIATGTRVSRGAFTEELLNQLTTAESSLVVNNCAAATLLVLSVFASHGEAIISRGEMVEIGGDFRIPDVFDQSGTKLREVGTTNRTRIDDYENAINADTQLLLRVHPSNYRIIGYTASVGGRELAELAHRYQLIMFEDAGSGALVELSPIALHGEPHIPTSIKSGADIVSFSGDKLLGGPQCGIVVGKAQLIEQLKQHPLYRALRASKLVYSALEATLLSYSRGSAMDDVPTLRMLALSYDELNARCIDVLERSCWEGKMRAEIVPGESAAGGGCLPGQTLRSPLIAVRHEQLTADRIAFMLRSWNEPIIARIEHERVLIDLRTVSPAEDVEIAAAITYCAAQNPA